MARTSVSQMRFLWKRKTIDRVLLPEQSQAVSHKNHQTFILPQNWGTRKPRNGGREINTWKNIKAGARRRPQLEGVERVRTAQLRQREKSCSFSLVPRSLLLPSVSSHLTPPSFLSEQPPLWVCTKADCGHASEWGGLLGKRSCARQWFSTAGTRQGSLQRCHTGALLGKWHQQRHSCY